VRASTLGRPHSVDEGLDEILRARPDAVICDLHMPGKNGLMFLRTVRSNVGWRSLPIAIVTRDLTVPSQVVDEVAELGAAFRAGVITRTELLALAVELSSG
jgi:CheY-like chemotaxis protein